MFDRGSAVSTGDGIERRIDGGPVNESWRDILKPNDPDSDRERSCELCALRRLSLWRQC